MSTIENRFVFYGEWLDNIADLPVETQDKIIAEIVRYGSNRDFEHSDDMMVAMAVNFTKGAIDNSKNEYLITEHSKNEHSLVNQHFYFHGSTKKLHALQQAIFL